MKRLWIALLLTLSLLQAEDNVSTQAESNRTSATSQKVQASSPARSVSPAAQDRLNRLGMQLRTLTAQGSEGNVWTKIYSSYKTYEALRKRQDQLIREIFRLKHKPTLTPEEQKELEKEILERQTNVGKLQLLSEFQHDPFKKLLEPPETGDVPVIGNPFGIISAISYLKKLQSDRQLYEENFKSLEATINRLNRERKILREMLKYRPKDPEITRRLKEVSEALDTLQPTYEIFKTTREVYNKKIEEIRLKVNGEIRREAEKAATIGGIILFLFLLFLIFKRLIRKYMADKESFYTVNKVSNLLFITVILLVLLFAYIENVNYLVTILGFASAGIAIAMKDWFMSMMGWFVIVLGGSIHVGDRIKVVRNGTEYVGDVVDISLLRMTIQEDITLTTYMHNRRAGRIIFVPNNYIFTDMIANYSHAGLKTVWDGIDFTITFDSDGAKAASIAKEIAKKYSKGYTDITRKQLNKLRSSYHLKNTNVEPRVFTFMEEYGIRVSVWYLTNAFATLTLRSTISSEILQRIREEKEIALAYPTQAIYMQHPIPHAVRSEEPEPKAPATGASREEPL
ncbi:mechanosensitive ion channel family protein [Nitratifractor salsuginis]|uniref:MscS Mechanosensitive ion channel n=1 Tax=Nitratifractor salsuginis (strain DSM 16511 / JCM 12458 / E9I37-1) TaxID=749222 RepID=E6WYV4_NITSE|nr:mechanosensitive ion channel domain-containing protein [Nitratifractor salsuginis]ADV46540.1 MscS Mechanosensitive ion channel [Nitratifractor salsuginis DSM 16511]